MTLSLCLVFFASILHVSSAVKAVITVQDYGPWTYRAEIAHDHDLEDRYIFGLRFSLMTPPDDALLCEFPPSLVDDIGKNSYSDDTKSSVALLVSLGGCPVAQKARVALEIQEKVSRSLKYVVFYNNNADDPNEIVTFKENNISSERIEFDTLGMVSVSTSTGNSILGRMNQWAAVTENRPEFLSEGTDRWFFPTKVYLPDGEIDFDRDIYSTREGKTNFFYFRFVLFTLLIVSPCCRAAYLWWAGGGRLRFRYNERGWIVGLQYIPPMSYWFASAGPHDYRRTITDCLTEEQVLALPEISYKTPEGHQVVEADNVVHEEKPEEELEEADIVVRSGSADENEPEENPPEVASLSNIIELVEEQPVESAPESPPLPHNYVTSCTTCSICIDDFVEGEPIRCLPKCKHAFHTDCIMPWLTERQGCCPLCKTDVLGSDERGEVEQENQQTGTDATNAEQESEIIVPPLTDEHQESSESVNPEPELEEEGEPCNASEDERVSLPQSPVESSAIDAPSSEDNQTETKLADDVGSQPKATESTFPKEDEPNPDANQSDVPSSTEPEVSPEKHEAPRTSSPPNSTERTNSTSYRDQKLP
jgi:hypothetical protein